MVTFGWGSGTIPGHGDIKFNESITIFDVDGSVTHRNMNPDGGFYDAVEELHYEEDAELSLHLSDTDDSNDDDDDDCFLDALQEQLMAADDEYGTMIYEEDQPRSQNDCPNSR